MLTLDAFTEVANRLVDDGSSSNCSYVVSDMNLDKLTIKLENNSGVDFTVTLVERDPSVENGVFNFVLNEVNYYGQDINLTSLRRHDFEDYDDGSHTWKYDKRGNSWDRIVFMRTHNKKYPFNKKYDDSFRAFMAHVNHVAELGYNSAERNDDWGRAAKAVKAKREENLANIDALIALEEPAAPAVDVFNELQVDLNDYCQLYGKVSSVKQYSTFAIVTYTARVGIHDADFKRLQSDWSFESECVCVIDTIYKFAFDTCTFERTKQSANLQNWSVQFDKMMICSDIEYSFRHVEADSEEFKNHIKRYVKVTNNKAALADLM